jgi:hypothetical protein
LRIKRPALPAALAAATLALVTFASPAFADDPVTITLYPVTGDVAFDSETTGTVSIDYSCSAELALTSLSATVVQNIGTDADQVEVAGGYTAPECDGTRHSAVVPLVNQAGKTLPGPATLYAILGKAELTQSVTVSRTEIIDPTSSPSPAPTEPPPTPTPTQPPAPVLASVSLTTNASPESVIKGKKITIKGTIRRDGKKFKAKTALEFSPDDGSGYAKVKSVTSSKSGTLSTTVKASSSGAFRYVYAGSSTTGAATSGGDHIVVKPKPKPLPKPKAYKNCTALHKVYPHGVGQSGAHDKTKGDPVTDFTRDSKTYAKNKKSDADKDKIACER